MSDLSKEAAEALRLCFRDGQDVYSLAEARGFRELHGLKLARITKPRAPPKSVWAVQPYFGVKLTAAGLKMQAAATNEPAQ